MRSHALLLVICLGMVGMSHARQTSTRLTPDPPVRDSFPTVRTVGTVHYNGPHTWDALVNVTMDYITFIDGTVTALDRGVPQGVKFHGNRRGITLRNLTFSGVGDGIIVGNDQRVDDLVIENCRFLKCRPPEPNSDERLLADRGYGIFASEGRNWTIRDSEFQALCGPSSPEDTGDCAGFYAARLGSIHGLNVQRTKFENRGRACIWLMFVRAASFDECHFRGGPVRLGVRPGDMGGVGIGDAKNIIFRNCTFDFMVYNGSPARVLIFPGASAVRFENCDFRTVDGADSWIEIHDDDTSDVRWSNSRWNGRQISGYDGVKTWLSEDELRSRQIGPAELFAGRADS